MRMNKKAATAFQLVLIIGGIILLFIVLGIILKNKGFLDALLQ